MMELRQTLSRNIKRLRKESNATLEEFSEDIGISRSTLQKIESGRANTTLDTVDTMAAHLGVPPAELLTERQETPRLLLATLKQFCALPPDKQSEAVDHFFALVTLIGGWEA